MPPKGISPQKWGRVTWVMLHGLAHLAIARPQPHGARAVRHIVKECMPALLPCRKCRKNLEKKLAKLPEPDARSVERDPRLLAVWVHELHNLTNVATGKPRVAFADGLDGKLAALSVPRLWHTVHVATRHAARYIARCVEERKQNARRSQSAADEYVEAARRYHEFRLLVAVVLGLPEKIGRA